MPWALCAATVLAGLALSLPAHADTFLVDFESQAVGAPSSTDFGTLPVVPVTVGDLTVDGGSLFLHEAGGTDQTGIYVLIAFQNLTSPPVTLTFAHPVTSFSVLVANGDAAPYTLTDNLGDSVTASLVSNQMQTFSLNGAGITSAAVTAYDTNGFADFAVDNIRYTEAPLITPEPASSLLLATGLLGLWSLLPRKAMERGA